MSPNFTPVSAFIGGALIGVSATLLWLTLGRIAGISGILGQALRGASGADRAWRILFLAGLPAGAWLAVQFGWAAAPGLPAAGLPLLVAGGLLVGFGTRLGGGCTSGHGVCGLARLSPRSLAATLVFMIAGMASTFVLRHLAG